MLGLAEVALFRVLGPIAAHVPSIAGSGPLVRAVEAAGEQAFLATAFIVVAATVFYLASAHWRREVAPALVTACLVTTLIASTVDAPAARVAAHATLAIAVTAVAAAAVARPGVYRAGAVVAAAALVAGRLPLFLDSLASLWPRGGGQLPVAAVASVAEAAFVLVPVALAVELLRRRSPPTRAWLAALAASMLVAVALAFSPSYSAIVSTWATGVTLSLPVPVYIVSASAAALVLTTWLTEPQWRLAAAGLVLLLVAGTQPAVMHHNLTAVLGLVLLASPAAVSAATHGEQRRPAPPASGGHLRTASGGLG